MSNNIDRRMHEHRRNSEKVVESLATVFHIEPFDDKNFKDRNGRRITEQTFMDIFDFEGEETSDEHRYIGKYPTSDNSKNVKKAYEKLVRCP